MKKEINRKENKFEHPLINDIKTCVGALIGLIVIVLLYFFLESLLNEQLFLLILAISGVFPAGAFYFFITRLLRIIGWFIKKDKWTKFGGD